MSAFGLSTEDPSEGSPGRDRPSGGDRFELPPTLSIPVPDGGWVTATYESDGIATVSLVYELDEYERLVAFYDRALPGWIRPQGDGTDQTNSEYCHGSSTVLVNLCVDTEADGFAFNASCVSITQRS